MDGADGFDLQQVAVIGEGLGIGEFLFEFVKSNLGDIASGDDFDTLLGAVHFKTVCAASAGGDKTDLKFFHDKDPFF